MIIKQIRKKNHYIHSHNFYGFILLCYHLSTAVVSQSKPPLTRTKENKLFSRKTVNLWPKMICFNVIFSETLL